MKKIDRRVLGPASRYLWREGRKRRYDFMYPPRSGYMLLPHLNLSPNNRMRIVIEELGEGQDVLSEVPTIVNGHPATILACRQWGVVVLHDRRLMAVDQYPLSSLASIDQVPDETVPTVR